MYGNRTQSTYLTEIKKINTKNIELEFIERLIILHII